MPDYEKAKKLLDEASGVIQIRDLLFDSNVRFFIQPLLDKYYSDEREYDKFYRTILSKSYLDNCKLYFERQYDDYLKIEKPRNYYIIPLQNLEQILAQFEIALRKVVSLDKDPAFRCTAKELKGFIYARFDMEKKIDEQRLRLMMMD